MAVNQSKRIKKQSKKLSRAENLKKVKDNWTVAEISLHYKPVINDHSAVTSIEEIHALIRKLWNAEEISTKEQFVAFFFNTNSRLIGYKDVSIETVNSHEVDVKLLCCLALHTLCSYVVIAHNHPCGNIAPSKYDDLISLEIQQALALIDVGLLDYFILVEDGYISLADAGWLL